MANRFVLFLLCLWLALLPASAQIVTTFPGPQGAQPANVTASATGTTGQITATLTGVANKWTYICGFVLTSAGTTAAAVVDATITGTISGTMNFQYAYVSSGQGLLGVAFPGCISSSAINTSIVVTLPAGGAGSVNAISVWGYTL